METLVFVSEKGLNLDRDWIQVLLLLSLLNPRSEGTKKQREVGAQRYALAGCSHHHLFRRNEERPGKTTLLSTLQEH